ncbi:hypothetical protein [Methanosphaera cuniculi]|uniref:Right handed beta helix domain-containing protein n=1 Tax=Methanosphaera cuniculi TaxID=1077256 RepID=A0A2V2BQ27_9EURY|nr:hypothetical protein [Methanosphaera cuniculi]PWL07805.1 hypothetical protein MSCUN_13360 [Methanosphaera cuniculi]
MKHNKQIFFLITIIILILTLTSINAVNDTDTTTTLTKDTTTNTADIADVKTNTQSNEKKIEKIQNNNEKIIEKTQNKTTKTIQNNKNTTNKTAKTYSQYTYGYQDLYNKVQKAKTGTFYRNDVYMYLESGNYNITQPIYWGNSTTRILKIYGNNHLLDGNNYQNFITVEKGYSLELIGFKIRCTNAQRGSVIYNKGTVSIYNSIFLNSTATNGGVIYNDGGTLNIYESSFSNNYATNGACIYNNRGNVYAEDTYYSFNRAMRGGVSYSTGSYTLRNTTSKNNYASVNGGVNYNDGGNLLISNSKFLNNEAYNYGGVNYNNKYMANLNITSSQATNNQAGNGGVNANYGSMMIQSCDMNNNYATRGGVNYNFKILEIKKTTFKNNQVSTNGAVNYNDKGKITISDCTNRENIASANGGVNYNNVGRINTYYTKHINNKATRGGVNYNTGITTLDYSSLTNNYASANGGVNYNDKGTLSLNNVNSTDNSAYRAANTYNNKNGIFYAYYLTSKNEKADIDADIIVNYGTGSLSYNKFIQTNYKNSILILSKNSIEKEHNIINLTNNTKITKGVTTTFKSPVIDTYTSDINIYIGSDHIGELTKNSKGTAQTTYKFTTTGLKSFNIYYRGDLYDIYINQEVVLSGPSSTPISSSQSYNVYSYSDLLNAFRSIKSSSSNKECVINIYKDLKITTMVIWGDSYNVKKVTIKGNNHVINGQNKYKFISVKSGHTLNLENVNIQNCNCVNYAGSENNGGAISNKGILNIKNSAFKNNKANYGGAILNYDQGLITITGTTFTTNEATMHAGAIYNNGKKLNITSSTFTGNDGLTADIYNQDECIAYITSSTFKTLSNKNYNFYYDILNLGYIELNNNLFQVSRSNYYYYDLIYNDRTAYLLSNTYTGNLKTIVNDGYMDRNDR